MTTETPCAHPDTWFDRSMCAEPCGSMHDRCTQCGEVVGEPCRNELERPSAQQELETENALQRQDIEDLQNQIEDLKGELVSANTYADQIRHLEAQVDSERKSWIQIHNAFNLLREEAQQLQTAVGVEGLLADREELRRKLVATEGKLIQRRQLFKDLEATNEGLQRELLAEQDRLAKTMARLETIELALEKEKQRSQSLRLHGGEHWFSFGYDKPSVLGSRYSRHCRVCDKEEDDPSHFGNGVKALSSKDVGEAVEAVYGRLTDFVVQHLKVDEVAAQKLVRDLLRGLPGVDAS